MKYALQVAILAECIAINPNPTMNEIDDLRYFFEKLKNDIARLAVWSKNDNIRND